MGSVVYAAFRQGPVEPPAPAGLALAPAGTDRSVLAISSDTPGANILSRFVHWLCLAQLWVGTDSADRNASCTKGSR